MFPTPFPSEGLTLQEALDCLATAEELAESGRLRSNLRSVATPRDAAEPFTLGEDSDFQRYRDECAAIEKQIDRINRTVNARLWRALTAGQLLAFGHTLSGEKIPIPGELLPVLTRTDFHTSSAWSQHGHRFDGIRIFVASGIAKTSPEAGGGGYDELRKLLKGKPKKIAAFDCMIKVWKGPPPEGIVENDVEKIIKSAAKELGVSPPGLTTIRAVRRLFRAA